MQIGVDAACWSNRRGYGRYTRELLRALVAASPDEDFVLFADEWTAEEIDLRGRNVRSVIVKQSRQPTLAASAGGSRGPTDMLRFTRAVGQERLDVFFSPSVYTYFPLPPRLPALVTIHDAIAERFPQLTLPSRRARLFWRLKVRLAVLQARLILTVSDFSARDLARVLGVPAERLRVAPEAPAQAYRAPAAPPDAAALEALGLRTGDRWITYVGGFNPHKNVDVLVEAHGGLARELENPPHLLLVGPRREDVFHAGVERIETAIRAFGTEHLVHWAGYVPDRALRELHAGSLCLALPSECEGFGLPAVEAAACGAPVVATTESPLPELLEGGGLFVPPGDVTALHEALRVMASDEPARRRFGRRAAERSARLSWTQSAAAVLAALREAAAGPGRRRAPHRSPRRASGVVS